MGQLQLVYFLVHVKNFRGGGGVGVSSNEYLRHEKRS